MVSCNNNKKCTFVILKRKIWTVCCECSKSKTLAIPTGHPKMRIFTHLSQIVQKLLPQPRPQAEADAQLLLDLEGLHNYRVIFCLASATAIAVTYAQIHSKFSPTFDVVSFKCKGWFPLSFFFNLSLFLSFFPLFLPHKKMFIKNREYNIEFVGMSIETLITKIKIYIFR